MRFELPDVRLVSYEPVTMQDGKELHFVKVANKATYDSERFMLSRKHPVDILIPGRDYDMTLDVEGKYCSVTLTPVSTPISAPGAPTVPGTPATLGKDGKPNKPATPDTF